MPLNINDARALGKQLLRIDTELFNHALEVTKKIDGMKSEDVGVMTLAAILLSRAKALQSQHGLNVELSDALEIISRAEVEFEVSRKASRYERMG